MKLKLVMSLLLGTVIALPACTPLSNTTTVPATPLTAAQADTDAKILGAVATLDQNEIAMATVAQSKATNMAVRRFADWMYKQHSQNLQEIQSLSQRMGVMPKNGPVAIKLQHQGKRVLTALRHANGMTFDRVYMSAMVKSHAEAVALLNGLIKVTANPMLVKQLEVTRSHVMAHLQKAQAVQKEMGLA
ncbi:MULTISPECIES: DUF4142 domain-containing protein [Legionella]|uniref:DUF4142 domain-containing protein n=1 Tax=Legionella drozanskii LLAP-1 TaxID=1212489 RepID=A0A0W0SVS7_9GAMM|nr:MULTISPECIES: DUF4142 domain-containing protein [Legionella]KTC87494.1 hypothetical protein Ldro_1113 [Legionella drozanskii LLAP-1]PJE10472.1 MAG: DUF4142 domain-containing protein [Legionella sp.]